MIRHELAWNMRATESPGHSLYDRYDDDAGVLGRSRYYEEVGGNTCAEYT